MSGYEKGLINQPFLHSVINCQVLRQFMLLKRYIHQQNQLVRLMVPVRF